MTKYRKEEDDDDDDDVEKKEKDCRVVFVIKMKGNVWGGVAEEIKRRSS